MRTGLMLPTGFETDPGVPRRYAEIRALAKQADDAGLDTLWMPDHLELPGGVPWEAWTTLTGLAEATSRIRLGPMVICMPFRPAGVLARMADTFQEVSGNRLVLGLGAGWHQPEFDAHGLPFDHLASRFADGLEIVHDMLGKGKATVTGRYQSVEEARIYDHPDWVPPPILVAGRGPRMLRLTAKYADSWNTAWYGMPDDRFRETNDALSKACEEVGRDPATLERTVGLGIGGHKIGENAVPIDAGRIAEVLAAWEAEGVAEAVCWPVPKAPATIDVLAEAASQARS